MWFRHAKRQGRVSGSYLAVLLLPFLLAGCVAYEPRQLVPSLTLSAENIVLNSGPEASPGVDFGLDTAVNESDSLFNVQVLPGLRVRGVNPGSPANQAGIQAGDVILSVNGTETNHPDTLAALALQATEASQTREFVFRLRRNTSVLQVSLLARPAVSAGSLMQELFRTDPLATRAGYRTELLSITGQADIAAARIVEIQTASPLLAAGLAVDDIILAINGTAVGSAQGLISMLNSDFELGDRVSVTAFSNNQVIETNLRLWSPGRRLSRLSLWPLVMYESSLSFEQTSLTILDLWLFAIYRYDRSGGERQHRLIELFNFTTDYGELVEETD